MRDVDSPPDTPLTMTSTLEHATSTIDDLTLALANFSRLPSPEPPSVLDCCCGREDCEHAQTWHAVKARLESRLTLSAEIGQALLQRSEAFSRRNEALLNRHSQKTSEGGYTSEDDTDFQEEESRISQLLREKNDLERRLTQALVNSEVTEVSNKTLLQELQDAKLTISRLSSNHARSAGWENRLSAAMKERDDMQQERDFESQRARLAESRFAALKDKTSKLQAEVRRLQDDLQEKRQHRLECSESIIQGARSHIQSLHDALGNTAASDQSEITRVLESLVDDNEALKRDNTELHTLLAQSRDDLNALQQEVEESRAALSSPRSISRAPTPLSPHPPHLRHHAYSGSVPSSLFREQLAPISRPASQDWRSPRSFEPLTPETNNQPLSPTEFTFPRQPPSPYQIEHQTDVEDDESTQPERARSHRPLFLLTRSRGVQTDTYPGLLSPSPALTSSPAPTPSPIPTPSPHDPRSESSSYSESTTSTMSTLVERVSSLLHRMNEADALSLTNRLKRQHLRGADIGHLSRTTVSNILNDVAALRTQFRFLLEDDKLITTCTRKDLRVLFKLFRELFVEMGQMRVTLNDVILDPSIAPKVSELALDPKKAETANAAKEAGGSGGGWMAPISKLFGSPAPRADPSNTSAAAPAGPTGLMRVPSGRRAPRFAPKIAPALAASSTTVNVEFSGAGVGRAITNLSHDGDGTVKVPVPSSSNSVGSSNVMGIFAGAPRPSTPDKEPWVVLPRGPRRVQSTYRPNELFSPASAPRQTLQAEALLNRNRLSRNVDAILDSDQNPASPRDKINEEEEDYVPPLLERTLRRRGLSDSSIHSTLLSNQGDTSMASDTTITSGGEPSTAEPSRGSVLQTLSKKVQSLRTGTSSTTPIAVTSPTPGTSYQDSSPIAERKRKEVNTKGVSGLSSFITSWATTGSVIDPSLAPQRSLLVGSPPRDADLLGRRTPGADSEDGFGRSYY
ncbi:hypothetical protein Moror_12778 [Moniliophthora roreri MCA 2997]|uniref:Uncharacterized protein n=1 Tax=Moniliophthora roreri (strain MCA 2997) TaxID=1381753 RepID=V2XMR6_MONRO|nr:hypothetical protein Moror_12778 [Moniliophthora roreri MCA 2997]